MTLSADGLHALGLLAEADCRGVTQPALTAHGFSVITIASLVSRGLATAAQEKVKTGSKLVEIACVRITDAGRDALAAQD